MERPQNPHEGLSFSAPILGAYFESWSDPSEADAMVLFWALLQRAPSPPEFAQPGLSRSNGSHDQREGTSLGVFAPILLVLPRREATNLCVCVFDLRHFDLLKRGCANSGGLGAR